MYKHKYRQRPSSRTNINDFECVGIRLKKNIVNCQQKHHLFWKHKENNIQKQKKSNIDVNITIFCIFFLLYVLDIIIFHLFSVCALLAIVCIKFRYYNSNYWLLYTVSCLFLLLLLIECLISFDDYDKRCGCFGSLNNSTNTPENNLV